MLQNLQMVSLEMRDDGKEWLIGRREKFTSLLFCFMPASSEKLISWDMSLCFKDYYLNNL